jgi:hypothetical protein
MKARAKYFCENCQAEVAPNARFCPKCGKFFAAVRCPKCGHTGDVKDFIHGCTVCGYAMPKSELYGRASPITLPQEKSSRKSRNKFKDAVNKANGISSSASGDYPAWLLLPSLIVLVIAVILCLLKCKS